MKYLILVVLFISCLTLKAQSSGGEVVRKSQNQSVSNGAKKSAKNQSMHKSRENKNKIYMDLKYKKAFSASTLDITTVEVTNEYTCLHFKLDEGSDWYNISPDTFIRDILSGKKYALIKADNCAIAPKRTIPPKGEIVLFSLYFEPIPEETRIIDFIESEGTIYSTFNIRDIILK